MNIVRLISCDTAVEAYLIKGKLNNEGIECFITNENSSTLMPYYNHMLGFSVQVMIDEADLERARELVKDKLEPDNKAIICPYYGSDKIGLGLGKHKAMKLFNIFATLLAFIPLGNLKPKYYCKQCKEEIR
jgi:hypothetical protein